MILLPLATKYRPTNFDAVVGQNHVKAILQAMVAQDRIPPAMIFSGTRGTGKTTCARVFAAALNCQNRESGGSDACGSCAQCLSVQRANSTSVLEIDAASSGGVDEVRRIRDLCLYAHEAQWRVILLDEAHSMSKEAYNALLKLLEEPPANTVFILVTTEPEKILGTVRSRSMPFEFRRIKNSDLIGRLSHVAKEEEIEATEGLLVEVAKQAQGGLRDALMLLDQVAQVGVHTAEEFKEFFGIQDYSFSLFWAALRGDHAEGSRLVEEHFSRTGEASGMVANLARLVSELLVIKSEGRPKHYSEQALADRVELAQAVSVEDLVRVTEILWELRSRTRATENDQRGTMELAFALITNSVKKARSILPEKPSTSPSPEKLSVTEMTAYAAGR